MSATRDPFNVVTADYRIKHWSDEANAQVVAADVHITDDNKLLIRCTEAYAGKMKRASIPVDGNFVQLDLNTVPFDVVAIALGLPGESPDFRNELKNNFDRIPNAFDVVEIALQGHALQSGIFLHAESDVEQAVGLNVKFMIEPNEALKRVPNISARLSQSRPVTNGLTATLGLFKQDNVAVPCSVVTFDGADKENAIDHLALLIAYSKQMEQVHGVKTGRVLKTGALENGQPYAVFADASRPVIKISAYQKDQNSPDKLIARMSRSELRAQRELHSSKDTVIESGQGFSAYYQAKAIRQIMEDKVGLMGTPVRNLVESGSVLAELPRLTQWTNIDSMKSAIEDYAAGSARHVAREAMSTRLDASKLEHNGPAVVSHLKAIVRIAQSVKNELKAHVEAETSVKRQAPKPFYTNEISLNA